MLINVGNQSVVHSFQRRKWIDATMQAVLRDLFDFQLHGFWFQLQWVSRVNVVAALAHRIRALAREGFRGVVAAD